MSLSYSSNVPELLLHTLPNHQSPGANIQYGYFPVWWSPLFPGICSITSSLSVKCPNGADSLTARLPCRSKLPPLLYPTALRKLHANTFSDSFIISN